VENIKEYIESGVLELYVIGDLSVEERLQVEKMASLYPEITTELKEIELAMEGVALKLAANPNESQKAKFLNAITFASEETETANHVSGVKVVSMSNKNLNFYKYSLAACLALLLVSVIAIVNLSNNLNNYKEQVAQLQSSNQNFANQVNYLDKQVEIGNQAIGVYTNPDNKFVNLAGTPNSPDSKMIIAFNAKDQKVSLDLKSMKMPATDAEHQYQLWALVDGVPVDLGVFDAEGNGVGFKDMKSIAKAQAFAVTLEPKGGSKNPTLDQMMVMGAI
jgi:anti-sigma-K factor RskA